MGIEGLQYEVLNIPLAAGLKLKDDPRAMEPPGLSICADARFDEIGGIQTRFPLVNFGNRISAGGIITGTLQNVRRIEPNGSELLCFTDTQLYSWQAALSAWVLKGTHLAVNVVEVPRLTTTGDQIDGDRAELAGVIVYAWSEGTDVLLAAVDKVTGAVLQGPVSLGLGLVTVARPRVVALATKILVFVQSAGALVALAVDPTALNFGTLPTATVLAAGTFNSFYDVVKVGSQDLCVGAARRVTTTSYEVFTVTPGLVVTQVTKARTADGPLAVSTIPDGTKTQVVRANGTNIQGDFLTTSTLADVTTGQAIGTAGGTPVNQIAAAHRSVQNSGAFRCYVFWSAQESAGFGSLFATKFNFVDSAGALGAQATFINGLAPGSRAFDYNGSVYLWLAFGQTSVFQADAALANVTQAQNAYLLYRDDAFIAAKCVYNAGGGLRPTTGLLPGVALTSGATGYSWCATERRRQQLGGGSSAFAARAPRDVSFTFDSNAARRVGRLGSTFYIAAGEILQYDGSRLVESGFHFYPWSFDMLKSGAGSVATGTYGYKVTWRWPNATGESDRSTTATIGTATMTGGPAGFAMGTLAPLNATHKTAIQSSGAIAAEVWRTAVNPTPEAPYFLATSPDPTNLTNPNKYIANDPTAAFEPSVAWRDEMADAVLTTKEANPENGTVLENLCPPAASIIFATDTRLFLGGVAGDPDRIWYSKLRTSGQVAAFHDSLTIDVPRDGGAITALAFLNETLVVFRETAVYALPGIGFSNVGDGQNFGPAQRLSADVGAVSAEAVALLPDGLIFKSSKGWYLLERTWNTRYIGADVSDFDGESVRAVHVMTGSHQVRCVTSGRILVFDYLVGNWTSWSVTDAVHAAVWNGTYYYLSSGNNAPMQEQASFPVGSVNYGLDVELGWIKRAGLQGWQRVAEILIAGEFRGAHALWIRTAYDYQQDGAGNWVYTDSVFWPVTPNVVGSVLQVSRGTSRGRCQAIKIRITAVSPAKDGTPPTTEALKLTGIALKVGVRKTPNKRLPAAQKV